MIKNYNVSRSYFTICLITILACVSSETFALKYIENFNVSPFTAVRPWSSNEFTGAAITSGNNWYYVTPSGSFPACTPLSATGMMRYNNQTSALNPGTAVDSSAAFLVSPPIDLSGRVGVTDSVRFNLFCSAYTGNAGDSVVVYINNNKSLTGSIRLGARSVSSGTGWTYNAFQIPFVSPFDTTSSLYVFFVGYTFASSYKNIFIDNVEIDEYPTTATLVSATVFNQNTLKVGISSVNQDIMGIRIYQKGSLGNLYLDTIFFNNLGCTNFSQDVLQAKVFYTGSDSVFSATTQFGAIFNNPLATIMKFSGAGPCNTASSLKLLPGYNYLWLVYDIKSTAFVGHIVDAQFEGVKTNCSSPMQGTAGTLPGNREVGASYAIPLWVYGTNNGVPGVSYARRTYVGRVHIDGLNSTLDNCFHDPVASPPLGYANTQTMEYAPHPNSYTYFAPVDKGVGSKKRRSVDLLRNSNYSLLISSGTWIGPNLTGLNMETNNIGAWIDFNGDGDFNDTYGTITEQLGLFYNMLQGDTSFNVLPSGVGYVTFPLNIPDTGIAPNGCPLCPKTKAAYVRLRISAKCSSGNQVLDPFNTVPTYFHGETEDYDVRLLADVCPDSSLHICKWIAGSATDPTNWHRIENWCPRIPTIVDEAWVQPNIAGNYPVIHTDSTAVCSSLKIFAPCTVTADAPDGYIAKSKASLTMAKDVMLGVTPNTNGRLIVNSSYQDSVRIPNVTQVNYTLQSATNTPFAGHRTDCRYQILLSAAQLTSLYGLEPGDKIESIIFPIKKNTAGVYNNFKIRYYLLNPASFTFVNTVTLGQEMLVNSAGTTNPLGLLTVTNGPFPFFNSLSFSTTGTSTTWTDNVFPNQFGELIWDGVKDIVFDISFNNAGGTYAAGSSAGIPDFVPLIYSGLARKCGYVSGISGIGILLNGGLFSGIMAANNVLNEDNTALVTGTYNVFAVTSDYQPAIKLLRSKKYSKFPIYVGGNWINNNQSAAAAGFVANLSTVTMLQHAAGFVSKLDSIQGTQVTRFNELVIDDTTGIRLAVSGVVAGSTALIIDTMLYMRRGMLDLNGYTVSIENPLLTALRDTNDIGIHRGFIRSENALNRSKVLWKTGLTNVIASKKYKFPFGSVSGTRIPLTISVDSGRVGDITVSTYATNNLNIPLPTLPDVVNNQCYNGPTFDGTKAVDRFWQIDVSSAGTSRASIEFMYQPGELTNGLTTTLNAQRYNKNLTGSCTGPGMWITALASGTPQTNGASVNCYACANAANAVQVQNVYNFSPWSLVALPNPLQVQLLRFDAKLMDNKNVKIDWATADESSLSKFEVLKSYNQKDFEVIAEQRPFYKLQNEYTAWDYNTKTGTQFYKLKLMNYDGTEKFSQFVPITIGEHVFEITSTFFSKEDGLIHLQFEYDNYEPVQILIYNTLGELLYSQQYVAAQPGVNYVLLNAKNLNGMNYVILQNSKEQKVKKLMSLK